ncbi:MAG: 30S ribosomal protein S8 [Terriglobia bacterium]
MVMTDPIADMLTRIRNANTVFKEEVVIPASRTKTAIAEILKASGYIDSYRVDGDKKKFIKVKMKYRPERQRVIVGLKRVSKPGLRVYTKAESIPRVLDGLGIAILSTPKGIMTNKDAKSQKVGGEVLCYVW